MACSASQYPRASPAIYEQYPDRLNSPFHELAQPYSKTMNPPPGDKADIAGADHRDTHGSGARSKNWLPSALIGRGAADYPEGARRPRHSR